MHIILDNNSSFSGNFKYSKNNDHLKLPKSIEKSDQYMEINLFDDVIDLLLFTLNIDFENLLFLKQPIFADFIEENFEYFNKTFNQQLVTNTPNQETQISLV